MCYPKAARYLARCGMLLALLCAVFVCRQQESNPYCDPKLVASRGDCFLYQAACRKPALFMLPIASGDTLLTAYNGKMKVAFNDSDYIVLGVNSKAVVSYNDSLDVVIMVLHGKIYANVSILPLKGSFKTRTRKVSASVKGTAFTVEVDEEETIVQVLEGKVNVTDKDSLCPIIVKQGERAVVNPGQYPCQIKRTTLQELKSLVDWVGKSFVRLRDIPDYRQDMSYAKMLARLDVLPAGMLKDPILREVNFQKDEEPLEIREEGRGSATERAGVRRIERPRAIQLRKRYLPEDSLRSPECIHAVIQQNLVSSVKLLYNQQLRRAGPFEGRILIRFTILPDGRAMNPTVVSSSTQRPDFDATVKSRICEIRFPPVKAVGEVSIVYPFDFKVD